jgi:hypothetical protein
LGENLSAKRLAIGDGQWPLGRRRSIYRWQTPGMHSYAPEGQRKLAGGCASLRVLANHGDISRPCRDAGLALISKSAIVLRPFRRDSRYARFRWLRYPSPPVNPVAPPALRNLPAVSFGTALVVNFDCSAMIREGPLDYSSPEICGIRDDYQSGPERRRPKGSAVSIYAHASQT